MIKKGLSMNHRFFIRNRYLFFLLLFLALSPKNYAEISFTAIKDLHSIIEEKFVHLSPLIGFNWWKTKTIEHIYRFGPKKRPVTQLLHELFHLQADMVTFDVTVLARNPAKYFNAKIVGTIIGFLEQSKGKPIDPESGAKELKALLAADFNSDQIVQQSQEEIKNLEKRKKDRKEFLTKAEQEFRQTDLKYKDLEKKINQFNPLIRKKEIEAKTNPEAKSELELLQQQQKQKKMNKKNLLRIHFMI